MRIRAGFVIVMALLYMLSACGSDDEQMPPTFNFYGVYNLESTTAQAEYDFVNDGIISNDLLGQVEGSQTLSEQTLFINPGDPDTFNMPVLVGEVQTTLGDGTPIIRFEGRTLTISVEFEIETNEFEILGKSPEPASVVRVERVARDITGAIVVQIVQELYDFESSEWVEVPVVYIFSR